MKTFNKITWIIFIIGLIFKYLLHWPGYSVLLLLSCFLLLIHGTINFIQNIKNDKPKSLISLSFAFLTLSLFFRMYNWFFQEYIFLLAFLLTVTCIILHLTKKIKFNFHLIILLFYFSFIFILFFIYFWQKNGINDQSRRNENWIWFVDKLTGIGSWAIVGNKMELKDGGLTFFYSSGEIFCDGQIRESVYIDTARFYDVTGKCIKNIIYYGNGNNKIYYPLEGKYYDYYKTGEIQTEGFVVNHKFEGLKKLYSKNGNISYQANMINGSGWSSDYYESGSMKDSFYLANGKQYGTYKEWYENGKLLEISNWNNSLQHGARVTFFENGVIKLKDFWTFGKRN